MYGGAFYTYILHTRIETRTSGCETFYPRLKPTRAFHIPIYMTDLACTSLSNQQLVFTCPPLYPYYLISSLPIWCVLPGRRFMLPNWYTQDPLLAYFSGVRISNHAAASTTLGKYLKPACCRNLTGFLCLFGSGFNVLNSVLCERLYFPI